MPFDLLIRNGIAATAAGTRPADVAVQGGKVAALLQPGEAAEARETVDARGLHVLPGAVDIHFHIRAPAFPERGTVESETRAAAAGGITTLFEMPISKPCCATPELVRMRREHFAEHAYINFGLYAAPGDLKPSSLAAMAAEGIIGFKMFTTAAPEGRRDEFEGLAFPNEADQFEVLTRVAETGLPLVVHAESADILLRSEARAEALDLARASTHEAARPALAEAIAVAKLLEMNIRAGARLHIAHVTSAATLAVLRRYRGSSDFSAETCPHYLLRTSDDVERAGVYGKVNPPIRGKADQDALWAALADGTLRHITTDHASFAYAEKRAAEGNFLTGPPGVPGSEVLVPMALDAVSRGVLTLEQAVALIAGNGADRFSLPGKGRLAAGADADLILVDMAGATVIDPARLLTHARQTAQLYAGATFKGRVVRAIVAGNTVAKAGTIVAASPLGRYARADLPTTTKGKIS